ncbi:enoyl-CoA hydratase/isomerase family protein [Neobacillus citreus]|uniref:Enoyl-CoA hydratase/isomerase family protein n=1 Tax=Neobacillus citreus TaxID=2833578 RepID=A0A942T2D6_9BACI|nr:enoyl-CoA hydratase/isomerase family protein [Neobacillus citreus]MCH6267271.1 enoyl-CoA hydratase/isomerase family protein [Neobacillus citreus]
MTEKEHAVLLEKDGQIAVITLNKPDKLNAFSVEIRDQLYEALLAVRDDPSVDALVLCGAGRGFCAGADLTEFGTEPAVIRKRRVRLQRDLWDEFRRFPKPIAAALHGFAVGSGLEMAMLCDFRFAAPGTVLSLPEAGLGMIPAAGGTQSLPRLVHHGLALEFALCGNRITAEEGFERRMISRIVPSEDLLKTTIDYMKTLVERNPQSSRWIKTLVANGLELPLSQGLAREQVLVARSWTARRT